MTGKRTKKMNGSYPKKKYDWTDSLIFSLF